MALDSRRLSRHSAAARDSAPASPATVPMAVDKASRRPPTTSDDAPPPRSRNTTTSRLKRMSEATARRFARPLSLASARSTSSSSRQQQRTPNKLQKSQKSQKSVTPNSTASRTTSRADGHLSSSRRSSLLSTRGSSSVLGQEEEEDLGELPVFGVAQRAYLASLMSLFESSSNSTPYSVGTQITDPSSGAPSLGPYEFDIHSSAIYKYAKERRLYVAWPELVHPPPEALLEFEMETLPLLERDLQCVSGNLGQQGVRFTYELRMSGYASAHGHTVTMAPTVWILYRAYSSVGAQASVAELHQAVADIFYLQKGFEIQEGGGRIELSSDQGLVDIKLDESESVKLSDGAKLSIHVEDCHEKFSVCGALCCVTTDEGSRRAQGLCRVGGLLKINGKYILGVTTAHAMLDGSGIFPDSLDETAKAHHPAGQAVDRDVILSETRRVSEWHNVTTDAAIDFLGISMNSRGEIATNREKPEKPTDFALLRLRKMPAYVRNKYIPPRAQEAVSITSTASVSAAAMDEGPVYIVCGGGDVADGQLIWGSACFVVRGRSFRVRRIQTSRPLSAGTTGAWVVRGEVLYGVIIAVYENEPFALMMTIERLFASILGSAFSIRSVELWDGKVPDVVKAKKEETQSSKPTQRIPVNTRRRAQTETGGNGNGEGSSKSVPQVNEERSKTRPDKAPEADGVRSPSPRPHTTDEATQTEESYVPKPKDPRDEATPVSEPKQNRESSPTPKATQRRPGERSISHSSDVSMSGAMPDHISISKGKERCDTSDCAVTTHTTASETLHRQDSGFGSEKPPRTNGSPSREETPPPPSRRKSELQALPIGPASRDTPNGASIRGDASQETGASSVGSSEEAGGWSGGPVPSTTTTASRPTPKSRRSSFQAVLDKTFRRTSSERDEEHGPPPAMQNSAQRPGVSRRSSSARDSNSRDSHFGIPPTGLDGSRPLSFLRRSSGAGTTARTGGEERPLSFTQRMAGKGKQAKPPSKENNFGIPPQGL